MVILSCEDPENSFYYTIICGLCDNNIAEFNFEIGLPLVAS
jgi:hypothetical protein